jgi:hypothetical protein
MCVTLCHEDPVPSRAIDAGSGRRPTTVSRAETVVSGSPRGGSPVSPFRASRTIFGQARIYLAISTYKHKIM